jgi:septal ring factor EnvC (AmiA/AmiB activator)
VLGAAAALIAIAGLAGVVKNEVQTNERFAQSQASLTVTRQTLRATRSDLASLQHVLSALDTSIDQSQSALASNVGQLQAVEAALQKSEQVVTQQGSSIVALQSCLGGVEEALNALSVGDQGSAIRALDKVSANCQSAAATDG